MPERRAYQLSGLLCILAFISALTLVIGWLCFPELKAFWTTNMKVNTAVGLTVGAVAVWIARNDGPGDGHRVFRMFRRIAGLFLIALGGATMAEHLFSFDLGIDQLLALDTPQQWGSPGRMAPNSMVSFVLLGVVLVSMDWREKPSSNRTLLLVLPIFLLGLLTLVGHLYSVRGLYHLIPSESLMAWQAALVFLFLGLAVLLARPRRGFIRVFLSDAPGGYMGRRLLVAGIAIPILVGWITVVGQHRGHFTPRGAAAAFDIIIILFFSYFIYRSARSLNALHAERERLLDREREALAEAEAERKRLRFFIEQSPVAVAMLDKDMRYLAASDRWIKDYRLSSKDVVGRSHYEIFPEIPERWREIHRRVLAGVVEKSDEDKFFRMDGSVDWLRWEIHPWREKSGEVGGVIMFTENISSRKRDEEALRRAVSARDEFLSIASHELMTPIASLKLQVQLAKRSAAVQGGGDRSRGSLIWTFDVLTKQIDRLTGFVEDLLDVARIQSGKMAFKREEVDLANLIRDVAECHSEEFHRSGSPVTIDVEPGLIGEWDQGRIEQVLMNLLTNAAKYAPGGPIGIFAFRDGDYACLVVQDAGPGIPKEQQDRIFERFERATASRSISGLGLGLFIVRQIVVAHHGTIQVESEGQGTRFVVRLPLKFGKSTSLAAIS